MHAYHRAHEAVRGYPKNIWTIGDLLPLTGKKNSPITKQIFDVCEASQPTAVVSRGAVTTSCARL